MPPAWEHGAMSVGWKKLAAVWGVCALSFLAVTNALRPYPAAILKFGDSVSYMSVARAIAQWNFQGVHALQFWGVSYLIALVSIVGHLPLTVAFIFICAASSLAATILAGRLWGWTIAALMTIVNFDWLQRTLLGGSEPLLMLLLLGAFFCVRKERWWLAALLASLATTVRPLGICALIAIGLVLLVRKEYRRFLFAFATGVLIGVLYVLPLHFYMHDSLATVHSYQAARPLFGIPFLAILQGTLYYHPPLTNLALSWSWIVLIFGGIALLAFSKSCAEYRQAHRVEFIFALLYTLAICCYNYPQWALGNFARFAIPSIPFALMGWKNFLLTMQSRTLLKNPRPWPISRLFALPIANTEAFVWIIAVVFPALAACSAYGIRNILR
jgi:Glycosyltransferase family 87